MYTYSLKYYFYNAPLFHSRFPIDQELRKQWIVACKRLKSHHDKGPWSPTENDTISLSISRPLMLQPQVDASYEEQLCHRLSNLILQNRHQVVAEVKGL